MNLKGKTFVRYNDYGNSCSLGFANTWHVVAFDSLEAAKVAVLEKTNFGDKYFSVDIIPQRDVAKYHGHTIEPFSGKRLVINKFNHTIFSSDDGYVGRVEYEY